MTRKTYNKLVRDLIPDIITASGAKPIFRVLGQQEFIDALKQKVVEEATEVAGAQTREQLITELADLSEVTKALVATLALNAEDIEAIRAERAEARGAFVNRILLEETIE